MSGHSWTPDAYTLLREIHGPASVERVARARGEIVYHCLECRTLHRVVSSEGAEGGRSDGYCASCFAGMEARWRIEDARSGLWLGRSMAPANLWRVGVRSFMRFGANLEDDVDALLCVTDRFDGRSLRREASWAEIYEALRKFLEAAVRAHREIELCLDAHATLAFASGFILEPKLGITIDLIQRSRMGVSRWAAGVAPEGGSPWSVEEVHVGAGGDLALAVSVTHDIDRDVAHFVQQARLPVERILSARVLPRPGASFVRDGAHALTLADSLAAVVKTRRPPEERARLHLFVAAPNGLLFFLGQLAHGFGPLVIYEHDFESGIVGAYVPSLALPQ